MKSRFPTILIVEDELPQLKALADEFSDQKFNVLKAENGKEGLKLAVQKHPDIVLLDIRMPVMDGMAMLKKLRTDPWGKQVPVIFLTNLSADDEQRMKDITLTEPAYYLVKANWSLKKIVERVKSRLNDVRLSPKT